jgi:hypothetical protein
MCPICGSDKTSRTACGGPTTMLGSAIVHMTQPGGGYWTSDRRLYLDSQGKVVEASDPKRRSLLVSAGGRLPMARAQQLGLVGDTKAMRAPPETKAEPAPESPPPEPQARRRRTEPPEDT